MHTIKNNLEYVESEVLRRRHKEDVVRVSDVERVAECTDATCVDERHWTRCRHSSKRIAYCDAEPSVFTCRPLRPHLALSWTAFCRSTRTRTRTRTSIEKMSRWRTIRFRRRNGIGNGIGIVNGIGIQKRRGSWRDGRRACKGQVSGDRMGGGCICWSWSWSWSAGMRGRGVLLAGSSRPLEARRERWEHAARQLALRLPHVEVAQARREAQALRHAAHLSQQAALRDLRIHDKN